MVEDFDEEADEWAVCEGSKTCILKQPWHIICLVLNTFIPGFGTFISAFTCLHLYN